MAQNTGTLISAAIRPNDSNDPIASAYSNEIMGGHHSVASIADRNTIIQARRQWGMTCYVFDTDTTYILKPLSSADTDIMDNNKWVVFVGGSSSNTVNNNEWQDSVLDRIVSMPSSPVEGSRYLYIGESITYKNKIITRVGTTWIITNPTVGMSVRVDDEVNYIYRFNGTAWIRENVSQVFQLEGIYASGSNRYDVDNPDILYLDPNHFYNITFNDGNNADNPTLEIITELPIRKIYNGAVEDIKNGDILPGIPYGMMYNSEGTGSYIIYDLGMKTSSYPKYHVKPGEVITIAQGEMYIIYGDLTNEGTINNNGRLVILNGGYIENGGNRNGNAFIFAYTAIPSGGTEGQVLSRAGDGGVEWVTVTGLTPYTAGDGLDLTGTTFSVKAGSGLGFQDGILFNEYGTNEW